MPKPWRQRSLLKTNNDRIFETNATIQINLHVGVYLKVNKKNWSVQKWGAFEVRELVGDFPRFDFSIFVFVLFLFFW